MGWIPLRFNQEIKISKSAVNNISHGSIVGLKILTHHPSKETQNSKTQKLILISSASSNFKKPKTQKFSCFLKSCPLCNKPLNLDKEVYMYRGDQGFCSVECRRRQIYLDERKEIEISTKNRLAAFRQRRDGGRRCDTSALLGEYRHRSNPLSPNSRAIFTLS